jgi:superoxide dismutase, Cu-Zn family
MRLTITMTAGLLVVSSALHADGPAATSTTIQAGPTSATAQLKPTAGHQARGQVQFVEVEEGVRIKATLSGLTPGKHGFHVHEKGDCSDPEAKSAGGHFNPGGHDHGAPGAHEHHAGDIGNVEANAKGEAHVEKLLKGAKLSGPEGFIGRGLIVHAGEDDLSSHPTGNAGGRVACAVIEAAATPE